MSEAINALLERRSEVERQLTGINEIINMLESRIVSTKKSRVSITATLEELNEALMLIGWEPEREGDK